MRERSHTGGPKDAAECLAYVVAYYPSGTKQETGSALDEIVEASRKETVLCIINELRRKTGEDYGDKPELWIKHLCETETKSAH
jgi:hypothetical protein